MKIWELKEGKTYHNVNARTYLKVENGELMVKRENNSRWGQACDYSYSFIMSAEYEEALRPVTWQEALEANSKGKRVRVETNRNKCKGYTTTFDHDNLLKDTEGDPMTALEITTGTWYILD